MGLDTRGAQAPEETRTSEWNKQDCRWKKTQQAAWKDVPGMRKGYSKGSAIDPFTFPHTSGIMPAVSAVCKLCLWLSPALTLPLIYVLMTELCSSQGWRITWRVVGSLICMGSCVFIYFFFIWRYPGTPLTPWASPCLTEQPPLEQQRTSACHHGRLFKARLPYQGET